MFLRTKISKSIQSFSDNVNLLKEKMKAADTILIGAGAGLSTSAGLTYSGERFDKYFSDFKEKYGIEIVKIQHNEDSKITREVGNIVDISESENDVIMIIEKLKQHYVTPVVMQDVIDDMKYEIAPR